MVEQILEDNVPRDQEHTSPEGLGWVVKMPCFLHVNFYIFPLGSVTVIMAE